jgi:hypothetical protein
MRTAFALLIYTLVMCTYLLVLLIYALGMTVTGLVAHRYLENRTVRRA